MLESWGAKPHICPRYKGPSFDQPRSPWIRIARLTIGMVCVEATNLSDLLTGHQAAAERARNSFKRTQLDPKPTTGWWLQRFVTGVSRLSILCFIRHFLATCWSVTLSLADRSSPRLVHMSHGDNAPDIEAVAATGRVQLPSGHSGRRYWRYRPWPRRWDDPLPEERPQDPPPREGQPW